MRGTAAQGELGAVVVALTERGPRVERRELGIVDLIGTTGLAGGRGSLSGLLVEACWVAERIQDIQRIGFAKGAVAAIAEEEFVHCLCSGGIRNSGLARHAATENRAGVRVARGSGKEILPERNGLNVRDRRACGCLARENLRCLEVGH